MRQLRATKLMKEITPELAVGARRAVALDRGARSLSRALQVRARLADQRHPRRHAAAAAGPRGRRPRFSADALERRVEIGMLPIARRDVERLQHIIVDAGAAARSRGAGAGAAGPAPPLHAGRSDHLARDPRRPARRRRALAHASGAGRAGASCTNRPRTRHSGGAAARAGARRSSRRRNSRALRSRTTRRSEHAAELHAPVTRPTRARRRTGSRRRAPSAGAAASRSRSRCSAAAGR